MRASLVSPELQSEMLAMGARIAELEAQVSEIHNSSRRVQIDYEMIIYGVRVEPGQYVMMRVGDACFDPTF